MGKPVREPITLKAFLVDRETGEIAASKGWKNRMPIALLVKLASWIYALEPDKSRYKLLVYIDGGEDGRKAFLIEKLRSLGIEVVDNVLAVAR